MKLVGATEEQLSAVIESIRKYFPSAQILFFGSRANGKFKPTSDLDVCLKDRQPLDLAQWAQLESDLSSSDLPYKVDLVDWSRVTPEFQKIIASSTIQES